MERIVMIGTPSIDGKVESYFADSLVKTIVKGIEKGIDIRPIYVCYDSLVQRARNDVIKIAYDSNVDDLVFIDSDMQWKTSDFFRLLNHDVDIVGGTARKKIDKEEYVVRIQDDQTKLKLEENGLVKVAGLGTGFLRLSKKCIRSLWNTSKKYTDGQKEGRMVFDIGINNKGQLVSEDISMSKKCKALGFTLYLDPYITCGHIGTKLFAGNFMIWLKDNNLIEKS